MQMLCTFALFSLVRTSKGLFSSFGFVDQQPAFIAYTLFSIISAPVNEVTLDSDDLCVNFTIRESDAAREEPSFWEWLQGCLKAGMCLLGSFRLIAFLCNAGGGIAEQHPEQEV